MKGLFFIIDSSSFSDCTRSSHAWQGLIYYFLDRDDFPLLVVFPPPVILKAGPSHQVLMCFLSVATEIVIIPGLPDGQFDFLGGRGTISFL